MRHVHVFVCRTTVHVHVFVPVTVVRVTGCAVCCACVVRVTGCACVLCLYVLVCALVPHAGGHVVLVSGTGTGMGGAVSLVAGTSQGADGAPMVILGSKALVRIRMGLARVCASLRAAVCTCVNACKC